MVNYYEILQIPSDATDAIIKKSFKQLILKHHPDKGGDTDKFHALKDAYETLKDPVKRRNYNITLMGLPLATDTRNGVNNAGNVSNVSNVSNVNLHLISPNIHIDVDLTLEDIVSNKIYVLTPQRIVPCVVCHGTGFSTHHLIDCLLCDGSGKVITIFGEYVWCGHCNGRGVVSCDGRATRKCMTCVGKRYSKKIETHYVPAFHCVMHSLKYPDKKPVMVFYGLGNVLPGKPPGDIVIHFKEIKHELFARDQLNLIYEKYLTLYDALFGLTFDIKIPTPNYTHKTIRITLDAITTLQNTDSSLQGKWFTQVVKGEGLQTPDKTQRGDLVVVFKIIIPDITNTQHKETLKNIFMSTQRRHAKDAPVEHKKLDIHEN